MQRKSLATLLRGAVLISLVSIGCESGPKLVPVGGKVTYKGQPLPKATVNFVADGDAPPAFTTTDEQGQYAITTQGSPGAVVGTYKVAITAVRQLRPVSEAEAAAMTNEQIAANHETLIPVKYNNYISSGLTATVTDDPAKNKFDFNLE